MMLQNRTPCGLQAGSTRPVVAFTARRVPVRRSQLVVRAEAEEDFEARLASLKRAKGQTPRGEGVKSVKKTEQKASSKKDYDYTNETVFFETSPSLGDLAVNMALGITLVWIPLSLAAVGRVAFVKYRFTDKRISVISTAPWETSQLDAAYQEIVDVQAIGRGVGLWGDMVVKLRSGDKVEMRAVPRWQEMKAYVVEKTAECNKSSSKDSLGSSSSSSKGFA